MSTRIAAGANSAEFQRYNRIIEHGHQPAHWTHKSFVGLAPIHILWPVDRGDLFRQHLRQDLSCAASFGRDFCRKVLSLGSRDPFELRNLNTSLFCEGERG